MLWVCSDFFNCFLIKEMDIGGARGRTWRDWEAVVFLSTFLVTWSQITAAKMLSSVRDSSPLPNSKTLIELAVSYSFLLRGLGGTLGLRWWYDCYSVYVVCTLCNDFVWFCCVCVFSFMTIIESMGSKGRRASCSQERMLEHFKTLETELGTILRWGSVWVPRRRVDGLLQLVQSYGEVWWVQYRNRVPKVDWVDQKGLNTQGSKIVRYQDRYVLMRNLYFLSSVFSLFVCFIL